MRVGIIGAGRVGCALAEALLREGNRITGVFSRNKESADYLNGKLKLNHENSLNQTIIDSDTIFVTVTDGQIKRIAEDINNAVDAIAIKDKIFFHCSGAVSSDVLQSLREAGAKTASLHPIQTFPERENGWKNLYGIYFGFEGDSEARIRAYNIVDVFRGKMILIESKDKPLYHAAACVLSNYYVVLSYMAESMFKKIGISGTKGLEAFYPLMEKTLQNIRERGSIDALTGPISRGDNNVVAKHIEHIRHECPRFSMVYKELGNVAIDIALKKGSLDESQAEQMMETLGLKYC